MKYFQEYLDKNEITTISVSNVPVPFYEVLFDEKKEIIVNKKQFIVLLSYFGAKDYNHKEGTLMGVKLNKLIN